MPRVGQNPMKWAAEVHHNQKITITTVVFIPYLNGYWKESLEVLKLCLQSINDNTPNSFDLIIFDNNSCIEVQNYLLEMYHQGNVQYLVLSKYNVGKVGAWNYLFSAAPGEIIVYTDSDVYFRPGWLEASLEILEAFPEAGMITAQPARRNLPRYCLSTLKDAGKDPTVTIQGDKLLPKKYLLTCAYGLGRTLEEYCQIIKGQEDVLLNRSGVKAFVSADHFQFLTTKSVLSKLLPFEATMPLGSIDDLQMDDGVDKAGFWRLSTFDYLIHHIGNTLPTQEELQWIFGNTAVETNPSNLNKSQHEKPRILQNRFIRRFLKKINLLSYDLLYKK